MTLWIYIAREIRRHPGRALLTLFSVAISVGAVVSVDTATAVTRRAYRQTYEAVAGQVALEVVAPEGGGFPQSVADEIARLPGVRNVTNVVRRGTIAYLPDKKKTKLYVRGIDMAKPGALQDYDLAAGRFCKRTDEALMDSAFATSMGVKTDDTIKFLGRKGVRSFKVVGLIKPKTVAAMAPTEPVLLPIQAAQSLFAAQGHIDIAQLTLNDGTDEKSLALAITKHLPEGVIARRPLTRTEMGDETIKSAEQGMNFCSGFSLVASVFIILNTFMMNVSERRRPMAILRAIGATRGQIIRLVLGEAFVLGALGAILGVAAGWAGAYGLTHVMGKFFSAALPQVRLTPGPVATAVALGLGVSMAAAYFPARWAGKITPLEGMSRVTAQDRRGLSRWVPITGIIVLLATEVVVWMTIRGWLPASLGLPMGIVSLVACVLILPALVGPLAWIIGEGLSRLLGVEGQLAERQIVRRQARAAFTTGVLFVAVCCAIGMGNTIINSTEDVKLWLRKAFIGDFFVGQIRSALAGDTTNRMPDELGDALAKVQGVANVDSMRLVNVTAADHPALMIVKGFTAQDYLPLDLNSANADDMRKRLLDGEVVIGSVLAQRADVKPGDTMSLATDEVTRQVKVAGLATEYLMGGLAVYMGRSSAARLYGIQGVDVFIIKADPAHLSDTETRLHAFCNERGLTFQSFADLSRRVDGIMAGVVSSLWVLLALAFVVAALGIANTLTMNVMEQTREIALLRVVAMTRRQIRKLIMAQAVILGLLGLGTGTVAGVVMSYVINLSLVPLLGHPVDFRFHPTLVFGCFGAALAIVLAAAWFPAQRASRIVLVEALQYE